MNRAEREAFDAIVEEVIESLPAPLRALIDEVPIIVLDEPTPEMLADLNIPPEAAGELCGLHTGIAFTERSIDRSGEIPSDIHLFRRGITEQADCEGDPQAAEILRDEIAVTLLHEIGHHFGLDEDELERLGYD